MFKRRRKRSPRIMLLEAAVSARLASARLGVLIVRLRNRASSGLIDENAVRLLERIVKLQAALEAVALRLETLANLGLPALEELAVVREVLVRLGREYRDVIPGVVSILEDLSATISSVAVEANVELGVNPESALVVDKAVEDLLKKAEEVAKARVREIVQEAEA